MSLQILLPLHTYPDGNSETLLSHATAISSHLGGELHALVLAADFPQVSSALGNLVLDVPSLMAGARSKCAEKGAALLQALTAKAEAGGIQISTSEVDCYPATFGDRAAVAARYHDLVLMGLKRGDVALQSTAEAVIFGAGRPVMLLPEQAELGPLDHVVIAWDGSRVAARAVGDAQAFLKRTAKVTIAVVVDEKALPEQSPGSRLAKFLAAHGLNVEQCEMRGNGRPIAQTLQDEATKIGAGMLVMGGFGHSRMRDFVLGGATRGVLDNLRMPVILSH